MSTGDSPRPRIIATTDGEIDDRCSMVRFLMYANEWDIEGLIYCSSRFHWEGHNWAGTDWIEDQIDDYAEVYDNLVEHDPGYPSPQELRDVVYVGNVSDVGEMEEDTPGSDRIVEVLLDDDPRPVYLQAWGGTNTIASALRRIEEEHPEHVERVTEKAVVYIILNQDLTLREYIQPEWPELEVLNSFKQFRVFAYHWEKLIPAEERTVFEDDWMREHVVTGHGPLASAYPTADPEDDDGAENENQNVARYLDESGYFVSEGDTPSYLHQIRVGLGSLEHPSYGGWGGRFELEPGSRNVWIGAEDDRDLYKPIWRWIPDLQRDWAARADWCVEPYEAANHPPEVVVNGEDGLDVVERSAEPGETVTLDAAGTSDPDGDALSYEWWQYEEAGTYAGRVPIDGSESERASVTVPADAGGERIHVILTARDDGEPSLARYRRVILDVRE